MELTVPAASVERSSGRVGSASADPGATGATGLRGPRRGAEAAWLAAIGLVSILAQVVLLRELAVAFYGSELAVTLALGLWLLFTAAGALVGRRAVVPGEAHVRALLVATAAVVPGSIVLARGVRRLLSAVPGAYLSPGRQLAAMAICLLPVCVLLGLLFQTAARRWIAAREGRTLAAGYAIESAGGVLGGLLATGLLAAGVQPVATALACGLVAAAAGALPWRGDPRTRAVAVAVGAVLAAALAIADRVDRALTGWNHPGIVATRDTPYGRVTLTRSDGQVAVFVNDAFLHDSEGTSAEELVHLAALQVAAPRRVLVLGGGLEGLVEAARAHRPERVEYVELDAALLRLGRAHLPPAIEASLAAAEVRVTIADPRAWLEGRPARAAGPFDLIVVGMPEPESGQTNRFYTREFFAACARRLAPGGVLGFRLQGAENLWPVPLLYRTASIDRALRAVFPDVLLLPGEPSVVLAGTGRLVRDPAELAARLRVRGLAPRLVSPAYVRYRVTNDRTAEIGERIARTRAPENRDARPVCYAYTLVHWLSMFYPRLAFRAPPDLTAAASGWRGALAAVAAALLLLVARRGRAGRRALVVGLAALAGMLLESAVILGYQVERGVLFGDLGILLMLFMAGLAGGSAAVDRLARRPRAAAPAVGRAAGAAALGALAATGLLAAWGLAGGALGSLALAGLLLAVDGTLVGAVFSWASLRAPEGGRGGFSGLYAADLVGGCLGSIVGSLALIPMAGLAGTAVAVTLVAAAALLVV